MFQGNVLSWVFGIHKPIVTTGLTQSHHYKGATPGSSAPVGLVHVSFIRRWRVGLPLTLTSWILDLHAKAPFTPSASNQTNVKDKKHSHRSRRRASRASTNLHTSNERCQFKLYIGYRTSNNNKWPKCSCRYQTPPDNTCANDVIHNDVTENDIIDSWMNMDTLLASRPMWSRRRASTRARASTRRARCARQHLFQHATVCCELSGTKRNLDLQASQVHLGWRRL